MNRQIWRISQVEKSIFLHSFLLSYGECTNKIWNQLEKGRKVYLFNNNTFTMREKMKLLLNYIVE